MNKDDKKALPSVTEFAEWVMSTNATPLKDIQALTELARSKKVEFGDEVNWQLLNHLLICAHIRVPPEELTAWPVEQARAAGRWAEEFYCNRFIREVKVPEMPEFLRPYYDEKVFPETAKQKWEAVRDSDQTADDIARAGEFWRVRWSEPDAEGRYLYVRHYGGNGSAWNRNAAERDAREFNEEGRHPAQWPNWKSKQEGDQ
jgi:hypothetical protein